MQELFLRKRRSYPGRKEKLKAVIHLDKPVSNSGRLKQKIYEYADGKNYELEVLIEDAVDHELKEKSLVATGDAIILDNGSTTLHLAKYLSQKNLTVATGSIPVIQELMNDNTIDLLIIGGTVRRYSLGAIGPLAKACLGLLKTNWLFMGASALSVEEGVLCTNLIEAETKQFMIKSADKVCLMADSKKMGASSFGKVCGWDQVDYFITDGIDDEARKTIEEQGVTVIIAQ